MCKFFFSAIVMALCAFLFSACVSINKPIAREDVFLDDGKNSSNAGDVTIDESTLRTAETEAALKRESYREADETIGDGSKISTMYDGFGNKTERRFFNQHPLLQAMVLRTSSSGQKEILIFGNNGEVKSVPPDMIDRAMTATADELAKAAGIISGRKPAAEPFPDFNDSGAQNNPSVLSAASFPNDLPDAERENAKTAERAKTAEKVKTTQKENFENSKNGAQNVKQAELEYQAQINRLNLKAKKNQTAKNSESVDENR